MGVWKKSKVKDERIINMQNKIYSEIYLLVMGISVISIFLKYFIYNLEIESLATELAILFFSSVYYMYRSMKLGIFSAEVELHDQKSKWTMRKKNFYISIAAGIVIALIFGIHSAVEYAEGTRQSIYYFVITTLGSLIIYLPVFFVILVVGHEMMKKKSDEAIEKMLGDTDEEKY